MAKTSPKVILPRKVAEAIEYEWQCGNSNADIFSDIRDVRSTRVLNGHFPEVQSLDVLMQALVNGYEVEKVEKTPEEKVREYYVHLKRTEDRMEERGVSGSQFRQGWQSVEDTLAYLGITIEGVND